MPLDRYGRVVVSPNAPMGMAEFAQLYSREGSSPDEAAANIHMNYPMEAKSRMSDAWSDLGINSSPEQYFSNPLNFQKSSAAVSPMSGPIRPGGAPGAGAGFATTNPLAPSWGTFGSLEERNMALASGEYDPTYISPLKRTEATMMEAARMRDMETGSAMARSKIPLDPNGTDQQILSAQLAGDMTGNTKRVLHSLQTDGQVGPGLGYEESLLLPPQMRPKIGPYIPRGGFGGAPGEEAISSKLDTELLSDPEFKQLALKNPSQAAHVYRQLTQRDYETDAKLHDKIRGRQAEFGRSVVMDEIKSGAKRDPATGAWMVWETREAPEGGGGFSVGGPNAPKPYRQLVKASPEKQHLLDTYYGSATGRRMDPLPTSTRGQQQGAKDFDQDPELAALFVEKEKKYGHALTPQEKMRIAYHAKNDAMPDISGLGHVLSKFANAGEYVKDAGSGLADALMWPLRQIPDPRSMGGIGGQFAR